MSFISEIGVVDESDSDYFYKDNILALTKILIDGRFLLHVLFNTFDVKILKINGFSCSLNALRMLLKIIVRIMFAYQQPFN